MPDMRQKGEGYEPDEAVRDAAQPDPDGAGEAIAEAILAARFPHQDA